MAVDQKKPKAVAAKPARTHIGSKELKQNDASSAIGNAIPEKWRDPLAIILIFVSLLIFFNKVLDSEHVLNAGDNIASEAFIPFLKASEAAGQNVPQWIPHIFSGMPAFAGLVVTGERTYDLVHELFYLVREIPRALFPNPEMMTQIFHYFLLGLGMFLMMRVTRNTSRLVALFAAFSAMYSTWILTYVMIGHNTKIFAVMTFPYILMAIEKLRQPKVPWTRLVFWSSILAVFFHYALESTHMQMVFYICLAVLIYFLYNGISELVRKQNVMPTIRTGVITIAMVGLAFAMSADRYMATLGYEPYSIRGKQPVTALRGVETDGSQAQTRQQTTEGGGLNWDYATQYSFSPQEMITFLVPGWFGFGKLPYEGTEINLPEGARVPTYWGQMLMTDAANYTGIVVFFLAVIGLLALWKRDRLIPPLAIVSLVALLLSFGGNLPVLFGPMFNYFPTFNKFRAPMMALVLMQLAFPIIAAITLEKILEAWKRNEHDEKERIGKWFKYGMYASAGLFAIFLIGRSAFSSSLSEAIAKSGKPLAQYPQSLKDLAVSTAMNDAAICLLFAAIACGLVVYFLKGKVSPLVLGMVILGLSLVDQWRVGSRPMEVTTRSEYSNVFANHDYVDFVKQDKSTYRVLDLNEPTSNIPASWGVQTIAGYHAAKMRAYQDVVDVTGKANGNVIYNPFMWNLLNTKYIIADGAVSEDQARFNPVFQSKEPAKAGQNGQPGQSTIVWENPQALPRAFFVRSYKVQDSLQTLYAMRDGTFDPRDVVFLTKDSKDFESVSQNPIDTSTERVDVANYGNENVEYKTSSSVDRIMFISDTWYPNWTATIDGKEVPIHKANYAFRALKIPAGQHTVTFTYDDPRYDTGKSLSLASNILVLLGIAIGIAGATVFPKRHKNPKVEVIPPPDDIAKN
jgi:hypothetical protein